MKIYTVYENKVYSLKVRETEKLFIAEEENRGLPFGCISRFRKEDCSTSPEQAIKAAINAQLIIIEGLQDKLTTHQMNLVVLGKLLYVEEFKL